VAGSTFVGHGTDGAQRRAAWKQQLLCEGNRCPEEAATGCENPAQFPSTERAAQQVVPAAQETQFPNAGKHREIRRVDIGRSTLEAQIPWESLVGLESRSFIGQSINTSAPPIFGFHLESLIKAPRYAQVQGVVIRIYVRCGEEHLEKVRVQSVINE